MAFADPQTTSNPAVGVHGLAALLNVWRDDQDFLHDPSSAPGADALRATNLTLSGNTLVLWTSEAFDVGAMHDNSTNNSRLTVPSGGDGLWLAGANVRSSVTSTITATLRLNGTTTLATKTRSGAANSTNATSISMLLALVATDYLEVLVSGGTSLDATVGLRLDFFATWIAGTQT